jgi:hypothetical protein
MPGTGSYTAGGSTVISDYIYDVGTALAKLPDNSTELIDPKDIRDSVWTLWNRVDDAQILASQSLAASPYYSNSNPTTMAVGGISAGTTFSGTYSLQQMFDLLLYPYTAPVLSLSVNSNIRQFNSGSSATLTWGVVKKKEAITSIVVDGASQTIAGSGLIDQSGTKASVATHSTSVGSLVQEVQTFTMSVSDGTTSPTATATITWRHKIYWGLVDLSSVSNPNLTTNPGAYTSVASVCTDPVIRGLTGAGVSPGSALATSYARTYTSINGAGKYLVFAHPTVFGTSPSFAVNGLPNTAFTKVRSASPLVTEHGLSVNYDVWVMNTAQNSALNIVVS